MYLFQMYQACSVQKRSYSHDEKLNKSYRLMSLGTTPHGGSTYASESRERERERGIDSVIHPRSNYPNVTFTLHFEHLPPTHRSSYVPRLHHTKVQTRSKKV